MCLGVPGQIVAIEDAERRIGVVDVAGTRRTANLACVIDEGPIEACIGQWVLLHVGFAMSRIDAEEARRTMALLVELGEAEQEIAEGRTSAQQKEVRRV